MYGCAVGNNTSPDRNVAEAGDYADGNSGEIRKNGGRILAAGKQAEGPNSTWKLTMPEDLGEESVMQKLLKQFDVILIEADGSKRLPLKVPSETEPVLVPQTGLIIAARDDSGPETVWRYLFPVFFPWKLAAPECG